MIRDIKNVRSDGYARCTASAIMHAQGASTDEGAPSPSPTDPAGRRSKKLPLIAFAEQ